MCAILSHSSPVLSLHSFNFRQPRIFKNSSEVRCQIPSGKDLNSSHSTISIVQREISVTCSVSQDMVSVTVSGVTNANLLKYMELKDVKFTCYQIKRLISHSYRPKSSPLLASVVWLKHPLVFRKSSGHNLIN